MSRNKKQIPPSAPNGRWGALMFIGGPKARVTLSTTAGQKGHAERSEELALSYPLFFMRRPGTRGNGSKDKAAFLSSPIGVTL